MRLPLPLPLSAAPHAILAIPFRCAFRCELAWFTASSAAVPVGLQFLWAALHVVSSLVALGYPCYAPAPLPRPGGDSIEKGL